MRLNVKKQLIFLTLIALSLGTLSQKSFGDDASPLYLRFKGTDQNGNPCEVSVSESNYGPKEHWFNFNINTLSGRIDTNIPFPFKATETQGGECSFIAGAKPDTFIIEGNRMIQRSRFVEFLKNWIQESTFELEDQNVHALKSMEVKIGKSAMTGAGACSKILSGKIEKHFQCKNLEAL